MAVTLSPFSPGGLGIELDLARETANDTARARAVTIRSSRPTGFSAALFVGRAMDDVPGMVGRLHSLCGRSHATASAAAIAAAAGRDPAEVVAARFDGLIAERLAEHLRSTFAGPGLGATTVGVDADVLADVRAVLASARGLEAGVPEAAASVERIRDGVARLGLSIDRRGGFRARPGSWAASMSARVGSQTGDVFLAIDRLTAEDDGTVIAALAADPAGFSSAPQLPGRRPETGPAARRVAGSGAGAPGVVDGQARLSARLAEIAEAADLLVAPDADKRRIAGDWMSVARTGPASAYAAVESPRGRLHHLVRLDDESRIAAYAMLAPTEWNFHAAGPLTATLRANRWGEADDKARVERIAALFDPCVGFDVVIRDDADLADDLTRDAGGEVGDA